MRAAPAFAFALLVAIFWFGIFAAHFTVAPTTGYSRDLYAQFFPRYVYAASVIWRGRIPLWNPYELCGTPFLATAQGVLNPFLVALFGLLPHSLALHVYFFIHFLLSGLLTYAFCRGIGLGWQGAAVAAVTWAFSPALTRSVYHPGRIGSLLYLPVVFLLGERLRRSGSVRMAVLLALALAAEFCSGYPELALDTAVLLAIALVAGFGGGPRGPAEARASRVAALALSAVLAVMLAGVQLLPLVELIRESARSIVAARPLLAPGAAVLGTLFGLRSDVGLAYIALLPALYVGAGPLLLAVCAVALGAPRLRGPIIACALGCVLALVGYRYLHLLPVYRSTRFAHPWSFLFPYFIAVLAGIGWEGLIAPGTRRRRTILAVLLFATTGAFVALGTRPSAAFALLTVAVLLVRALRGRGEVLLTGLLLAVIIGDLFAHLPYFRGTDPFPPLPRTATTRALLDALHGRGGRVRFLGAAESYAGLALTDRVRSIAGLEGSVMPRRFRRIVDHFNLAIAADMPLRLDRVVDSKPLLDLMGVAYVTGPARWGPALARAGCLPVVEPSGAAHGLWQNPAALPRAFLVRRVRVASDENEAFRSVTARDFRPGEEAIVEEPLGETIPPGPLAPGEGAWVVHDAAEEVTIETSALRPAVLVVADSYFPGWEARVDDAWARIARADFAFRAVAVPAGRHAVRFTYRPRAFRAGVRLSLAGLAVVAGVLAGGVVPWRVGARYLHLGR